MTEKPVRLPGVLWWTLVLIYLTLMHTNMFGSGRERGAEAEVQAKLDSVLSLLRERAP